MNAVCLDIVPVETAIRVAEVQKKLFHIVEESAKIAERSGGLVVRLTEELSRMSGDGILNTLCFWWRTTNDLLQKKSTIEVLSLSLEECDTMLAQLEKNISLMQNILEESEATIARLHGVLEEMEEAQSVPLKRLADARSVYVVYQGAVRQCRVQIGNCVTEKEWLIAAKEQMRMLLDLQYDLLTNNKTTLAIRHVTGMLRALREKKEEV